MGKDVRRERKVKELAQKKADKVVALPVNKGFLQARNEKGLPLYDNAIKIVKWKLAGIDQIQNEMRNVCAYVDNIRYSIRKEREYAVELESGVVTTKNKHGVLANAEELYALKTAARVNQYGDLTQLRIILMDKLLAMISEDIFTGAMYDEYVTKTNTVLKEMGFELAPSEMEIIFPE